MREPDLSIEFVEIFPGISMDPDRCSGKPHVTGTRIDVATVVGALGTGQSFDAVEETYDLTHEQLLTALRYASYVTDHLPLQFQKQPDAR